MTPDEVVAIVLGAIRESTAFGENMIVSADRIEGELAIGVEMRDGALYFLEVQPA